MTCPHACLYSWLPDLCFAARPHWHRRALLVAYRDVTLRWAVVGLCPQFVVWNTRTSYAVEPFRPTRIMFVVAPLYAVTRLCHSVSPLRLNSMVKLPYL